MKTQYLLRFLLLGLLAALGSHQALAQTTAGPSITTQPASQTVAAGGKATFDVTATGTAPLTYRWFKEARVLSSSTASAYVIDPVKVEDAGAYRVEVSNSAGSTVSNLATLTVDTNPPSTGAEPTITTQPISLLVNASASATFSVVATGTPAPTFQWYKDGASIRSATSATLTISGAKTQDAGVYHVVVSNRAGSLASNFATLSVNAQSAVIGRVPDSPTAKAGGTVTLTAPSAASGLTYQWRFKGRTIKGATNATLTLTNVGTTVDGGYTATLSNSSGVAAVAAFALTVTVDARLVNISTRGHVGDDDEVLIGGFVIRGRGTKMIVARAVGPTLGTQFNVADALAKPTLTLYNSGRDGSVVATNSGWGGTAALSAVFAQVGAFPLPATSVDAALLQNLSAGAYTAQITAPRGTGGVALAEIYDADTGSPGIEVVNISTRAHVGAEANDTLIAGFAITGTTSDTLVVRGVGASLGTLFGLRRALGATHIAVYNSAGVQVAENTVWGGRDDDEDDDMDGACDRAGAWRLPRGSRDSALLLTLAPGVYTAHVTGVNRASGIGLVEIYEVH
jgi:hypothetical protein